MLETCDDLTGKLTTEDYEAFVPLTEQRIEQHGKIDILVKNTAGDLMLIEVQNERERDFFHRMNFGQAKLLTEHIAEGEDYENIKKIFSINIVYFNLGLGKDYVYIGSTNLPHQP